ncbi:MAG: serine hydrolase domain-containing protein [Bacteroidales bacterium]|jgi:CubicO group peptidase (beta-lactamase class C family)|nr:serine hydrolase domain-containing protein [Bacteroidales bacterium]
MNARKFVISSLLFLLIFFGEIALSFSDKSSGEKIVPSNENIPLSYKITNNLSAYESMQGFDVQINEFMESWKIVGASVAVIKDEKLIYSKGFGYADKENKIPTEPKHIFRVASVSKLITAIAIMKLVEEGKLSLSDTVFGENGVLKQPQYQQIKDKRVKNITVKNLLNHSAGWSSRKSDPMFKTLEIARAMKTELPLNTESIIEYVLKNRKLDFNPGKKSSYSNLGYAILGEIIEIKSGLPYETFVKLNVLNPIGIYDMHLGKSEMDDLFKNEVKYYGLPGERKVHSSDRRRKVAKQYVANSIETLGAAGAWVASSTELAILMVYIDGYFRQNDILTPESVIAMIQVKKGMKPIGWSGTDGNGNWWRSGTLSGTSALLKRQNNGISWVFIMNTTPKYGSRFTYRINKAMTDGLQKIEKWPTYDLFDYYEPSLFNENLLSAY